MTQDLAPTTPRPLAQRPSLRSRDISDVIDRCLSASERDGQRKLSLRNMPSQQDRMLLSARARTLLDAFKQHDRKEIAIAVMDMLASYDVAQMRGMTAAERKAAATLYVRELAGVPTWAIQEACSRIRLGTAPDISHHFKPTPIQVRVLALQFAQPWKSEATQISEILTAPRHVDGPSEEERKAVGIKMRTLADELKEGAHRDDMPAERKQQGAFLERCVETSQKAIEQQWAALGREPPKFLVSVTLTKLIGLKGTETSETGQQD